MKCVGNPVTAYDTSSGRAQTHRTKEQFSVVLAWDKPAYLHQIRLEYAAQPHPPKCLKLLLRERKSLDFHA